MDNAGKYRELREMHKEFIYHGYDIADDGIFFHFSIDDYIFIHRGKNRKADFSKCNRFSDT